MLKDKRILLCIIFAIALFLIPSMCNAAEVPATETTTTSTGTIVKWSYTLSGESIVDLKCINKSEISGEVVIPSTLDGYTVVGFKGGSSSGIFSNCKGLTGVTIPETVNQIADHAFWSCSSLTNVTLPNGLKYIGDYAFCNTRITSITIPDSVINIGTKAFCDCSSLTNVELKNGLISIGSYAFEGTRITSITIPDSVTNIGNGAFRGCNALTNVTLPKEITVINTAVFSGCSALTSIVIPNKVTSIIGTGYASGAFYNCKALTKILIPDSVSIIESDVFDNCSNNLTIYGNDGQASKKYAEDNNINFNYIANWNNAGNDITPPAITSLKIAHSAAFKLDSGTKYYLASAGTNISIKATFEEVIFGETAPKLTIKCGNGENIELTNGVIQGSYITYTYTIKENDKGIITAVSMTGGNIEDESGNKVEKYTCPVIVDDLMGRNVYANGTVSNQGGNNGSTVTLSSIAVTTAPTKVSYTEGEKFDKAGMVITATYSDGTKKEITNYSVNLTEGVKITDTKVVITYTENNVTKTVDQTIEVKAKDEKPTTITLESIKVTTAPTKTKYTEGEKFDKTGMVVKATYSDGTTKTITNYSVSLSGKLKTTDKKVTITYTENRVTKTVDQVISVAKDTTIKGDNKMPQTGAALLSLALVALIAVAAISKLKYGKYKDI